MSKESDFTTKVIIIVFLVLVLIVSGFFVFQMINDNGGQTDSAQGNQTNTQDDQSTQSSQETADSSQVVSDEQQVEEDLITAEADESNRCIITVNMDRYDVTEFRDQHYGGNVFECGEDLTPLFNSQHGMDYSRIRPYLID